ncbi:hypothetical protein EYF80_067087 [Liparis tanakae]|uniref:Uncharacterized protein n=1 Tax=Liparis tanakae TaxID=230148 RepID=A0A4Z2E229_9TELE|nr:hypothetical protein EYF80_067087 [Liparis tanakae]
MLRCKDDLHFLFLHAWPSAGKSPAAFARVHSLDY